MTSASYWEQRFHSGDTPWELNSPSLVLREALALVFSGEKTLRGLTVLSPGCGTGADAIELARQGASVIAVDWSQYACEQLRVRVARRGPELESASISVVQGDFFALPAQPVDVVCEHTFFCALEPMARCEYLAAVERWLKPGGYLIGNFFVLSEAEARELPNLSLTREGRGPPFAVTEQELRALFSPSFDVVALFRAEKGEESRRPGIEWVGVFRRR